MLKKILDIVLLRQVFLPNRFFLVFGMLIGLFIASYPFPFLMSIAKASLLVVGAIVLVDLFLLFNNYVRIDCDRELPRQLSLGDDNTIKLEVYNAYGMGLSMVIVDELPDEFQRRDFEIKKFMPARTHETFTYTLRPTLRGEYTFHKTLVFIRSILGLVERRISYDNSAKILVYPSLLQMKQFELFGVTKVSLFKGAKKVRRIGHSYEFDQIRNYVKGDDFRSVNWKATSRRNDLMVNEYADERSQQIYCVIDKGRSMQMPFNGLSLMDYAINTSLVISNVALHKHDKAGLLTFSDRIGATVKADSGPMQLRRVIETLYKEQPRNYEANYELLYTAATRQFIRSRSLLFLYTNFESHSAMLRVLPILRKIASTHLLVVIFFENTEILDYSREEATNTEEIYYKTIAAKFVEEKYRIVQELRQFGIQAILTRPEELSIDTVNKYLELKARGMI